MLLFPHTKHEWLRVVLFPFKAFTVIAPVTFFVSVSLHPTRRFPATHAEELFTALLLYDAVILLLAAWLLGLTGPKGFALPTAGFGLAAFLITFLVLMPALAR